MKYIRERAKSGCRAISFCYGMSLKPLYFLFNSFLLALRLFVRLSVQIRVQSKCSKYKHLDPH